MDLFNVENRLLILESLRENSSNMRIEQANLRDRISHALVRARTSLLCIRQLNVELQEMKTTVDNALAVDFQDIESMEELAVDSFESIENALTESSTGQGTISKKISEELINLGST